MLSSEATAISSSSKINLLKRMYVCSYVETIINSYRNFESRYRLFLFIL